MNEVAIVPGSGIGPSMFLAMAVLFGLVMIGIGAMLLFQPGRFPRVLLRLNRHSSYAASQARFLERRSFGLRVVSLLAGGWGVFVLYVTISALTQHRLKLR